MTGVSGWVTLAGAAPSGVRLPGAWAYRGQHWEDSHVGTKHRVHRLPQRARRDPRGRAPRSPTRSRRSSPTSAKSLKLIASENYASPAVLLAMGNWLSDKYAEGTIGRRFYAGCRNVDTVESIAAEHAHELFGAQHAYVQPHSGIDANLVAFWAVLAQRVEAPALAEAGVRQVNDLSDADWAQLRQRPRRPADARHVPGRRWPPHPRLPAEHLRQDVRPAQLRHRPGDRPARLRRAAARPRGLPPADHRGRLLRLPAPGELRASCARSPTRSARR